MPFLILTRKGYEDLVNGIGRIPSPVWVGGGVLSDAEMAEIRAKGIDLTVFVERISAEDASAIAGAIETIEQHHCGQTVWLEHPSDV